MLLEFRMKQLNVWYFNKTPGLKLSWVQPWTFQLTWPGIQNCMVLTGFLVWSSKMITARVPKRKQNIDTILQCYLSHPLVFQTSYNNRSVCILKCGDLWTRGGGKGRSPLQNGWWYLLFLSRVKWKSGCGTSSYRGSSQFQRGRTP